MHFYLMTKHLEIKEKLSFKNFRKKIKPVRNLIPSEANKHIAVLSKFQHDLIF